MAVATVESAFLTSLNAERKTQQCRAQKRQDMLQNMEGGDQILKLHGDLQSLADLLDEKVEAKLNANENAFFLAYKNFMYTVQKEFKELKQKADEEETKTRRDAKIQSLEKELDWFMHEALRLDELCKKHKKELDRWKSKAEALEEDRQFLENSIKTAKRNNKNLRGAVEKAQTSAYAALVSADDNTSTTGGGRPPPAPAITAAGQDLGDAEPAALALEDTAQQQMSQGLSAELEGRYQGAVKKLKQQLETEQRLSAKLRAVADRQFGEPSELEAFFVECVERVKANVDDRRQRAAHATTKASKKTPPTGPPTVPSVSLDDFTVSDRRQVIELLLSSEEVLQFLYDKLFPSG